MPTPAPKPAPVPALVLSGCTGSRARTGSSTLTSLGACNRTGACCHLMFTCPLLDQRTVPVRCSIHEVKPRVCNLFPIDERDLRDRDIIAPDTPCGFSFVSAEEARRRVAAGGQGTA